MAKDEKVQCISLLNCSAYRYWCNFHSILLHISALHCISLHCLLIQFTTMQWTALHLPALHALHCILLHCHWALQAPISSDKDRRAFLSPAHTNARVHCAYKYYDITRIQILWHDIMYVNIVTLHYRNVCIQILCIGFHISAEHIIYKQIWNVLIHS